MRLPKVGETWVKRGTGEHHVVIGIGLDMAETKAPNGDQWKTVLRYWLDYYAPLVKPRLDPLDQAYVYGLPTVFDAADLEELRTSEAPRMSETKCECGAEKAGLGGHSSWCPKFQNLKESA